MKKVWGVLKRKILLLAILIGLICPKFMLADTSWTSYIGVSAAEVSVVGMDLDTDGLPYTIYADGNVSGKASVLKFNGTSWTQVGTQGFTSGSIIYPRIVVDVSGNVYAAFRDVASPASGKASVYKWDGSSWVSIGTGISASSVGNLPAFISDRQGNLYLAYKDIGSSNRGTVLKWDKSSWTALGGVGSVSTSTFSDPSLAVSPSGNIYVSYVDGSNSSKLAIKYWDGVTWNAMLQNGATGISQSGCGSTNLAFHTDGSLYVAYKDASKSNKATVLHWEGVSWNVVGATGISAGTATDIKMALTPKGNPYVTYQDVGNSNKLTVLGWDGSSWSALGGVGVSTGNATSPAIRISSNGTIYVGYCDVGNSSKLSVKKWRLSYTASYRSGSGGSVSGGTSQTINFGDNGEAVTAVPNSGFAFSSWSDGKLTASRTDRNVSTNISVTANFSDTAPTAPTAVSIVRSGNTAFLSWVSPTDGDFSSVTIRRSTSSFPSSVSDGIDIATNYVGTSTTEVGLDDNTYFYSIFAKDEGGNYSAAATASIIIDTTPPVTPNITAIKPVLNGTSITITWNVPATTTTFSLKRSRNGSDPVLVSTNIGSGITAWSELGLEEGSYRYYLIASDSFGNASATGNSQLLTIDITGPATPNVTITKLDTNSATANITWTVPDTTQSFNYRDNSSGFDGIATANNHFLNASLSQGLHRISVIAIDAYGNKSATGSATVFIDSIAPTIPTLNVIKPSLNGKTLLLNWTVPTTTATLQLKRQVNGGDLDIVSSNISATLTSLSQINLNDGIYQYFLYAIDAYRNTSNVSQSSVFTIDTTGPATPNVMVTKLDTNSAIANITWTVPDTTFSFNYRDNLDGLDGIATANNRFLNAPLSQGFHNISVIAVDAYGNKSATGSTTVFIDSIAPTIPTLNVTKPSLNGKTLILNWTVPTTTATLQLKRKVNGGSLEMVSSNIGPSITTLNEGDLNDATYQYFLYAIDAYRNTSNVAASSVFTIDATRPSTPVVTATKLEINSATVNITWSVPETTYRFNFRDNGSGLDGITTPNNYFLNATLSQGLHVISVVAVDEFGNRSVTGSTTVFIDSIAPDIPTINASKPLLNGKAIFLSWEVPTGTATLDLKRKVNGGDLESVSRNMYPSITTFSESNLNDATYQYFLYAIDAYRNTSNVAVSSVLIIDTTRPATPDISVTKLGINSTTVNITWSVPETTYRFNYRDNTTETNGIATSNNHFFNTALSEGYHVLSVVAVDAYGNKSATASTTIEIDSIAPSVPAALVATVNKNDVTLMWQNPIDTAIIRVRKSKVSYPKDNTEGDSVLESESATSHTLTGLDDGIYYVSVFSSDSFGNSSAPATVSFTVNTITSLEQLVDDGVFKKGEITLSEKPSKTFTNFQIGNDSSAATLNLQTILMTHSTQLGVGAQSSGVMSVANLNATWNEEENIKVGVNGGEGRIIQSNGQVTIAGNLELDSDNTSKGRYDLSGGTLQVKNITMGQQGRLNWTGGSLQVENMDGNLENNGGILVVQANKPLTINGNYEQASQGEIKIELSQSVTNETAIISVSGTTHVNGRIAIQMGTYLPEIGDSITLIQSEHPTTRLMEANQIEFELPALDSRLKWDTTHFSSDGTIRVMAVGANVMEGRPLNYPNPFKLKSGTQIGYWLNRDADMELRVYTASGTELYRKMMVYGKDEGAKSGYNKISLSYADIGEEWPSGVYPYVLIHNTKVIGTGNLVVRP